MKRKSAPEVSVKATYVDVRAATSNKYDKDDPDFVHVWQEGGITQETLAAKNMEVVKAGEQVVKDGGDILCRMPREDFERKCAQESESSVNTIGRLVKDKGSILNAKKVKSPIVGDE